MSPNLISRRQLLGKAGLGFGMIGLWELLIRQGTLAPAVAAATRMSGSPLSAKPPHFEPKAKAVILLFSNRGPSHVDTFDYKPELAKRHGQQLKDFDPTTGFFKDQVGGLLKSPFTFRQYGQSGKWVSSLFPHLAQHVDKMAFIH